MQMRSANEACNRPHTPQNYGLPFPFESGCRQTPLTPRKFAKCVKMRADER